MIALSISVVVISIWLALGFARSGFWRIERHGSPPIPKRWPSIDAIVPARNEATLIGETLLSLWRQNYPGILRVIVIDDQSDDGTTAAAERAASEAGREGELQLIRGTTPPLGWTGKVWAMRQGLDEALARVGSDYILFADADISHGPDALSRLVSRAELGPCDLVSFMVRLRCESAAEKLMIPAFVFFFRLLYPFPRVNNPRDSLAGAAGGTMLVRADALRRIGGLEAIRGEMIDDCALAREIKRGGHRIWLGLSDTSVSTRSYGSLSEIVRMIARTAYAQLEYSPARLAACVAGLALTFLGPPVLAIAGTGRASLLGGLAWLLMCAIYAPMLQFYRRSLLWAPLLPVTATIYLWATALSSWRHYRGRGGEWKDRVRTHTN